MSIFNWISNIFKPVSDLVDNVHTSTEEKLTLRNELAKIEQTVQIKLIELEQSRLDAMSKVEIAESESTHWLRANWRPLCAISLVISIILDGHFGYVMKENVYSLAEIFLGSYAGGRTLEKVVSIFKK